MSGSYIQWSTAHDIPLLLSLVDGDGVGVAGLSPQVGIRRARTLAGVALDNFWWNGTVFIAGPNWITMTAVDATNQPGVYQYLFAQTLVGLEQSYMVHYRSAVTVVGYDIEMHAVSKDAVRVDELHKIQGLAEGSPMQVSTLQRSAGGVTLGIAEAGGTVTVTRQ